MKVNKIIISLLLLVGLFNIRASNEIGAMESVVIDEGGQNEYTVPADETGSAESGIASDYVQTDSKKLNFEKNNLEGLSGQLGTSIQGVHERSDGKVIVLVAQTNHHVLRDQSTEWYYHAFLLIVNRNGVVEKSMSVATGQAGSGMSAWKDYKQEGSVSQGVRVAFPKFIVENNRVYVTYSDFTTPNLEEGYYFSTDMNLTPSSNQRGIISSFDTSKRTYPYTELTYEYNSASGSYDKSSKIMLLTNYWRGADNETQYEYAIANLSNKTRSADKAITIRTFSQMTQNKYPESTIDQGHRHVAQLTTLSNGDTISVPYVSVKTTDGRERRSHEVVVSNSQGAQKYLYKPELEAGVILRHEISNANEVYFTEHGSSATYLKKMNVNNGSVTTVKTYPVRTNIEIIPYSDPVYGSTYQFYGYAGAATGEFDGYGISGGAVLGTMDANFNVISASIIATNPAISLNIIPSNTSEFFSYGSLGTNKTFANKPTTSTNSVAGNGWIDKSDPTTQGVNTNVFMGSMSKVDDYAPAINVGDSTKINIDTANTTKLFDAAVVGSVEVYDTFDLSAKNPANDGLTAEQMMIKLQARVNRNPENLSADIEWDTLGLDKDNAGFNQVKFFVTDSNNQVTADSKIINIITDDTAENGDLAIDAKNFRITLEEAKALNEDGVLVNSSATSWNMVSGADLDIAVNASDVAAINAATGEGIYEVRLVATEGSESVEKTIKVFVGGTIIDPEGSGENVLFAEGFRVHLDDASSYTEAEAIVDSEAKAYSIKTGNLLDGTKISADVSNVNSATKVGPAKVNVTYPDGTKMLTREVIASIYDKTVEFGADDAISAKHIVFGVSELESYTNEELRAAIELRSAVKAWDLKTGADVAFTYDESVVLAEVGDYDLTFTTENATVKSIKVYVTTNPTCTGDNCTDGSADEVIDAKDFKLRSNEVATLTEDKVIALGYARAIDLKTGDTLALSADYSAVEEGFGSYDVIYSVPSGLTKTVKATVGDNVVIKDDKAIGANNVVSTLEEVEALNGDRDALNEMLLKESGARAWVIETNATLTPVSVNSDSFDFDNIEYKSYDVVYTYTDLTRSGSSISITAKFTVDDEKTTVGEKDVIYAESFGITVSEVEGLTDEKVIELAKARAWLIEDNSDVEITSVDFSQVEAARGAYVVEFTTSYGTTKQVYALVDETRKPEIMGNYAVYATNYSLEDVEVEGLNTTDHVERADAYVVDMTNGENVELTHIDVSSVASEVGVYNATFGIDEDYSKAVAVDVWCADDLSDTGNVNVMYVSLLALLGLLSISVIYRKFINKA